MDEKNLVSFHSLSLLNSFLLSPSFHLASFFLSSLIPSFHVDVGETFSNQLQAVFTLAIGLIIGFTASWKISLVVIATFPINVCTYWECYCYDYTLS